MNLGRIDKKSLLASCLILLVSLLLVIPASSKNEITPGDCGSTVEVRAAFYGAGADERLIARWETAVENFWNGAAGYRSYGDCDCKLRFDMQTMKVASRAACPRGFHCIEIQSVPPHGVHRSSVSANRTAPGFNKNPYSQDATGDWASNDDGLTIAHEVGHILGFEDDYFDVVADFDVDAAGGITFTRIRIPARFNLDPNSAAVKERILEELRKIPAGRIQANRSYTYNRSIRKPGVDNRSIMAQDPGETWIPLPSHISKLADGMALACADKCCCGNGRIDRNKGEECDKNMTPAGCAQEAYCSDDCKCKNRTQTVERTLPPTESIPSSSPSTTTTRTTTTSSTSRTTSTTTTSTTKAASSTTTTIICEDGTYKKKTDCDSRCDPKHGECKLDPKGCYFCNERCEDDVYMTKAYCEDDCDLDHCKCLIDEDGCYGCNNLCPLPRYATSAACNDKCDLEHSKCNVGTDGCYSCSEVCGGDTYRTSDCGGSCAANELCTANLETGCYSCVPIDCGAYCSSQGGYAAAGVNVASGTLCQESYLRPRMTSRSCYTTCGFVKFKTYSNGYHCCCIKVFWLPCQNCPCEQPCEPSCPGEEGCDAAEPGRVNEG
jgi:hypothetical protein